MPVLDFNNKEEVKEYEDFILNHVGTSFMQDLNWGKVKYNWKQLFNGLRCLIKHMA